MQRKLFVLTVVTLLLGVGGTSTAQAENASAKCPGVVRGVNFYRTITHNYQTLVGANQTRIQFTRFQSCAFAVWTADLWRDRAKALRKVYDNPPHKREWKCIHRYEGHWRANTGNGYYGGLQMDLSFQRSYGRQLLRARGTADNWTPLEQMWVAERAHRSGRGFYPWPNTARYCGLI